MGHVYLVTSTKSDKVYVGYTIRSLKRRLWEHIHWAQKGGESHFAKAIRLYGGDSFSIRSLFESSDIEQLLKKEAE